MTFREKIEYLLSNIKNAKLVYMSKDVYKEMKLKGKTMRTSQGLLKIKLVDGLAVIGVSDGTKRRNRKKRLLKELLESGYLD